MISHSDLKFLLWSVFAANSPGKISKFKLHFHKLTSNPGRSLGTWLLNFSNNLAKSESESKKLAEACFGFDCPAWLSGRRVAASGE